MKQKEKIRLLAFIAGASITCLLIAFGVVHAQEEGCREWKVRGQNQTWLDFVAREIPDDIDSVCIPVSCADMRLAGGWGSVRQMTIEEKVELLFTMIRRLEAEINCLKIELEGK